MPRGVAGDAEEGIPGIGGSGVRIKQGSEEGILGIVVAVAV